MNTAEDRIRRAILSERVKLVDLKQLKFIVGGMRKRCDDGCGEDQSELTTCTEINTDTDPLSQDV